MYSFEYAFSYLNMEFYHVLKNNKHIKLDGKYLGLCVHYGHKKIYMGTEVFDSHIKYLDYYDLDKYNLDESIYALIDFLFKDVFENKKQEEL